MGAGQFLCTLQYPVVGRVDAAGGFADPGQQLGDRGSGELRGPWGAPQPTTHLSVGPRAQGATVPAVNLVHGEVRKSYDDPKFHN